MTKMQKNIILSSLRESFISIWKNKMLFIFLFILQIIFLSLFSIINFKYQSKIVESSNAIFEYIAKQQLDEASVSEDLLQRKSVLGEDPLVISRNFNGIIKNFRIYMAYLFSLLIAFLSASWALTNKFAGKVNFRQLANIAFKNLVISLFYLGLIFIFLFSLLNVSSIQLTADSSAFFAKLTIFIIISTTLSYFMPVSLSLAGKIYFKDIVQKTLMIGIKRMHYVLAAYFINILFLAIPLFFAHYFFERSAFVFFMALIAVIFSFVFGRILVINVVGRLD
jgi:hypothetical protein